MLVVRVLIRKEIGDFMLMSYVILGSFFFVWGNCFICKKGVKIEEKWGWSKLKS